MSDSTILNCRLLFIGMDDYADAQVDAEIEVRLAAERGELAAFQTSWDCPIGKIDSGELNSIPEAPSPESWAHYKHKRVEPKHPWEEK